MKSVVCAGLMAGVVLSAGPALAVQAEANQTAACGDVQALAAVVQSIGYAPQVKSDGKDSVVLFSSHSGAPVGMTYVGVPEFGGCFALVYLAPFDGRPIPGDSVYAKFNTSQINGFGAVAGTFENAPVLATSRVTKFGTPIGNLGLEIELFAERSDEFAKVLSGGGQTVMDSTGRASSPAFAGMKSPAADPAIAAAMHTLKGLSKKTN